MRIRIRLLPLVRIQLLIFFLCESGFDFSPLVRIQLLIFFYANPDSTSPFGADPVTDLFFMRIRIRLLPFGADPVTHLFFMRIRIRLLPLVRIRY